MATAGSLINAIDYNNVQTKIANILGVGSATRGYGQTVASSQVTSTVVTVTASQLVAGKQYQIVTLGNTNFTLVGAVSNTIGTLFVATGSTTGTGTARTTEPITALEMNRLKLDILKIANHAGLQTNGAITAVPTVNTNDLIAASHYNAISAAADYLDSNRFLLAQYTDQSFGPTISQTRTTSWNKTVRHAFTIDFGNANNARYFFNSGSSIRFSASRTGGTTSAQNTAWSNMLTAMGTIVFNYNGCYGATGSGSAIGFYQLKTTPQQVYQKVPSNYIYAYGGNDYTITMSCDVANNSNGGARYIYVTAYFNDDYQNSAYAYSDLVNGTLTHNVTMRRASGANVDVAAPTATNTILLTQGTYDPPPVVVEPDPDPANFYNSQLYYIYPQTSGPHTFNVPSNIVTINDTLLMIFLGDEDHDNPSVSAPSGSQSISFQRSVGTDSSPANGTTLAISRAKASTTTPSITFTSTSNDAKGLLYVGVLPSRFYTCTTQVMGSMTYTGSGIPANNANFVTFTAPFNGYYFCFQGFDVSGTSGNLIPGTVVPGDPTYGIGFGATAGTWTGAGPYVVPASLGTSGGFVQRVDWAYLTAGTTVTCNYKKLLNTRQVSYPGATMIMTVVGFQTTQ